MSIEERVDRLRQKIAQILNDDSRYAIAQRIRELGYIDFRDFYQAKPALAHVYAVEKMIGYRR